MAVQKIQYETLDRNTKADIKKTALKIVVAICNIAYLKKYNKMPIIREAIKAESESLYESVSCLNKKQFKGEDMRNYRKFIEHCFEVSAPLIELITGHLIYSLSNIMKASVHDLACICANLYDDVDLSVKVMTMTTSKDLIKILKL